MDASTYYITTLSNAATKLGPLVIYALGGYFLFIKLPFLFFLKGMKEERPTFTQDFSIDLEYQRKKELENQQDFQRRMRLIKPQEEPKQEEKKEEPKKEKQEQPKKKPASPEAPENVFEFAPGESFTKKELKKRYHELLKRHHPDKVSVDLKKAAERKTKEINSAYAKLKSKAA